MISGSCADHENVVVDRLVGDSDDVAAYQSSRAYADIGGDVGAVDTVDVVDVVKTGDADDVGDTGEARRLGFDVPSLNAALTTSSISFANP